MLDSGQVKDSRLTKCSCSQISGLCGQNEQVTPEGLDIYFPGEFTVLVVPIIFSGKISVPEPRSTGNFPEAGSPGNFYTVV